MCLIILAWKAGSDLPLAVAANRDEWRDRPTEPAHWWNDHPDLLAGRDLEAGGTWMGITRGGRFAAVTNFRDPSERRTSARSRGTLVTGFLLGSDSPREYLAHLASTAGEYNGFNLVLGDGATLWYYSSREDKAREIEPGVHGLVEQPPQRAVAQGREGTREDARGAARRRSGAATFRSAGRPLVRGRHSACRARAWASTGSGASRRRSSPAPDYGTRSSTVLTVDAKGKSRFEEHVLGPQGDVLGVTVDANPARRANAAPA